MTSLEARQKARECHRKYLGAMKWWWYPTSIAAGWYEAYESWLQTARTIEEGEKSISQRG